MGVVAISRAEFDQHRPLRGPEVGTLIHEQGWYATEDRVLLGVIAFDTRDKDWAYVVLGRDEERQFRAIDHDLNRPSFEAARDGLVAAMTALETSGRSIFPQG